MSEVHNGRHPEGCQCLRCIGPRDENMVLRVTKQEKASIEASAELHGMKVSDLIRWRLEPDMVRP